MSVAVRAARMQETTLWRATSLARHRVSLSMLPVLFCAVLACERPGDSGTGGGRGGVSELVPLADFPAPPRRSYSVVDVQRGGGITGVVELSGEAPRDSTPLITLDENVCAPATEQPSVRLDDEGRLQDVVVWLSDIRRGRRVPLERRFEITNTRCMLVPRVQAVLAGGTLNVRSADPVLHRTRLMRAGREEPLSIVEQNDFGQVVPVEHALSDPGLLVVTCDTHPWTLGWIAVFDHPYFAVTAEGGAFSLDSVPPGRYTLAAWHERLRAVQQTIEVRAGESSAVVLRLGARRQDPDAPRGNTSLER